jgi:S-DNA-T family DNA segregation ATPase FtsK/SpoIIIE
MKGIQAMAQKRKYVSTQPQIIFEGNAPAKVQKNKLLYDLLSIMDWPAETRNAAVWLGEPIAIKEPTSACFRRQSGSNLLIVGQNDEAAAGMVLVSLVSLAAQYKPQDTRFYILNFSQVDAPYVELFAKVGDSLPHSVQIVERRKSAEVIGKTFTEVKKRLDTESAGEKRAIFLTVFGIQRARDLRQEDDFSYGTLDEERERSPSDQFDTILKEGPDVGIFTIAWCDSYTNLMRTLDRRTLREFEMRVIFQMNSEDSSNLIDSPLANKLGPYRSLYFSEEDGRLEKFRPYGLPTKEWLAWVAEQLQKRKSG